ncbi:ABC transporter permease [Salinicoccus sp. Marseille-QA3877]
MFLALKELKHSKWRFTMIGMILVLIAWLVFILSGLGNGLANLSAATFKNMDADYVVFEEGARDSMNRSLLPEDLINDLMEENNVGDATAMSSNVAVVLKAGEDSDSSKMDVSILGIEPGSFLEPELIEGDALDSNKENQVIVNDTLQNDGVDIGDTLEIEGSPETLEVAGFVENETFNHLPAIFTVTDKWREIALAAPGADQGIENPVQAIMLQGENIDAESLEQNIDGVDVVSKQDAINGLPGYTAETGTINMMLGFLFVISAFVISVFFYVLTLQKVHQFGVMKAIGASNGFLAKTIVSQVTIVALLGILAGVGLTYLTALVFPEDMPFLLDPVIVFTYAFVLLVVAVLSSLISVRKIAKIDPLQAMGRVE